MAAIYPIEFESPKTQKVSIQELERALEQLTQEVAEEKRKLKTTFQKLHQMLVEREERLMAELNVITADILVKVEERRESLEKLTQQKEETEKKLQVNVLNDFLEQQLSDIQNQIDKILSEQIIFPRVYFSCHMENIQKILEDSCCIINTPNPYIFRTLPLWNEGKGKGVLIHCSDSISTDWQSQLIYVAYTGYSSSRIDVFNIEGEHHSTLFTYEIDHIYSMHAHGDYIYASSWFDLYKLDKRGYAVKILLRKKGDTVSVVQRRNLTIFSLFIEDRNLYTCSLNSLLVMVYDLNLEYNRSITLQPISFDENTTPRDIIVRNQQIFVLFCYFNLDTCMSHYPDPIQTFQQDGTLIRSIVTGSNIKYSKYFCLDSYENILVSDTEGHCIRIFSPEGILIQSIGRNGELRRPGGISIDFKGKIIILNRRGCANLQAF